MYGNRILLTALIILLAAAMLPAQEITRVVTTDASPTLHSMAVNPATGDVIIIYSLNGNDDRGVYLAAGRQKGNGSYKFKKPRTLADSTHQGSTHSVLWNPATGSFLHIYADEITGQIWLQERNKKGKPTGNRINPGIDENQLPEQAAATLTRDKNGAVEHLVLAYELAYSQSLKGKSSPAGLYIHVLNAETYDVHTASLLVDQNKVFDIPLSRGTVYAVEASPKGELFIVSRRQVAELGSGDDETRVYGYMLKSNGTLKKKGELSSYRFNPNVSMRWYSKKGVALAHWRKEEDGGVTISAVDSVNRRLKMKQINDEFSQEGYVRNLISSAGPDGPLLQCISLNGSTEHLVFSLDNKGRLDTELLYATPEILSALSLNSMMSDYIEKSGSLLILHHTSTGTDTPEFEIRVLHLVLTEKP